MTYNEARNVLHKAQQPLVKHKDDGTPYYEELVTDAEILEALAYMRRVRDRYWSER